MVVFFDIDGTIVDEETQAIPESTVRAVEKLKEKGHIAVVNTGRPLAHIDPRVRAMAFSGWVCGCGMEILLDGQWLTRSMPSPELCAATLEAVRRCNMQALYEAREGAVYTDGEYSVHPVLQEECRRMAAKGFTVAPLDEQNPRFMKLVTFDCDGCRREEFLAAMEPYYTCIDRGRTMLELVLKGHSKAQGMERLMEALGLSRDQTLAIGDSTNDLPMFSVAGHTVCMGNGMEQLKTQAEFITDTVLNDGIEKALKHFCLL
jgi:Cof subfamily protein (haloacid dehalogenase superfamily)